MKIVIKKNKIINMYIFIVSMAFFLFGTLVSYNSMQLDYIIETKIAVTLLYSIVMYLCFLKKRDKYDYDIKLVNYFILYFLLIAVSSIINGSIIYIFSSVICLLIIYILKRVFCGIDIERYKNICLAMIVAYAVIYYLYSVQSYNSQGMIIACAGVMFMNYLCVRKKKSLLLYLACCVLTIYLVSLSRSRTSMTAFILVAIFTYRHLFSRKFTFKSLLLTLLWVVAVFLLHNYIAEFINEIYFNKWGNQDITSNRTFLWSYVLRNVSLFGCGTADLDTHNTYMQIMYSFGLLPFAFAVYLTIQVVRKILRVKNRIIYMNFFAFWFVISMFENLNLITSRFIPCTILFFVHLIMLVQEEKKSTEGGNE